MTLQERQENLTSRAGRRMDGGRPGMEEIAAHRQASNQHPRGEGGALAYLIETPEGSILWKDTSGHWTGMLRDLRPDVALLAAAGRGNIDGEPIQGSLAQFVAREADLLRPRRIVLSHHDDWMPPVTRPTDVTPIREELSRVAPYTELVEMGYLEGVPILPAR
jgi:L-ascorbate metabolism protein UlaG (beta-lactamase superfamily)